MYPLPKFVSKTVASQASAPRDVSLLSVAGAVLGGLDCIIYVVSGVFLLAIGEQVFSTAPSAPGWIAAVLFGAGAALILLVAYRIWFVRVGCTKSVEFEVELSTGH
jgi:hypothetical protein